MKEKAFVIFLCVCGQTGGKRLSLEVYKGAPAARGAAGRAGISPPTLPLGFLISSIEGKCPRGVFIALDGDLGVSGALM